MSWDIGLIGTGWVTSAHLEALKKIPGANVRAVAGRNGKRAAELAEGVGGKGYEDYREMLSKETLDAVFVLTPPHVHGDIEKACVQAVPAVFLEKPISNNLDTALCIQEAFEKAGTIVSVGYMTRYRQSVKRALELFSQSPEKPATVNGWWVGTLPGPLWWRNGAQSGGQFVEQCTHIVDTARYLTGEITRVSAFSTKGFVNDVADYSVDDAMTVNVEFSTGAIGNFTTGCISRSTNSIGLSVESRDIKCAFSGWDMGLHIEHGSGHTEDLSESGVDIFVREDKIFLEAIASKDISVILSPYPDAVKTLAVTLAATESAQSGKTIAL